MKSTYSNYSKNENECQNNENDVKDDRFSVEDISLCESRTHLQFRKICAVGATQTPLTLAKIVMIRPSVNDDQPTCSSAPACTSDNTSFPINSSFAVDRKCSRDTELHSTSFKHPKSDFNAYRVKEMSIKVSREASTQATPPHPSLLSARSLPASRDILQISTSLSSEGSRPQSEILTVTTDYANSSPDTRSILVDVVDHNNFPTFSKTVPNNGNQALQLSLQEAFGVPRVVELPSGNSLPNQNSLSHIRVRRWRFKKCLTCTSATEEQEQSDAHPRIGEAPPTYSSICTTGNDRRQAALIRNVGSSFVAPIPPPSYAQTQGVTLAPYSMDHLISLAPNLGGLWTGRSTAAICPRCTAVIFTVVEVRQSVITHIAAFFLFLLGCWPCCMVPYCINSLRITDHYCPICRTYLGTYTPC